jgi:hypothetical protein
MAKRSPFKITPETVIISVVLTVAAIFSIRELIGDITG